MVLMLNVRSFVSVAVSRRVAMIALIAGLFFISAPAWAQISLVHVTPCGAATFPATPCTIPATATGNLIVVAWASAPGNASTISAISDNAGNVYAEAGNSRAIDLNANDAIDIWYAKNSKSWRNHPDDHHVGKRNGSGHNLGIRRRGYRRAFGSSSCLEQPGSDNHSIRGHPWSHSSTWRSHRLRNDSTRIDQRDTRRKQFRK